MSCQTYNTIIKITLPFPPAINATDIVNRRKPCKVKSKGPNAFLIYRKAFLEHLSHLKYNLKMTDVSKLVSKYWENETDDVKDAYRKISKEVEDELVERRKQTVSNRLIWKNSTRKRNRVGRATKSQNKSKDNTKANHSNRNFLFVTDTIASSLPQKHGKKITTSNSESKNSGSPSENFQNLEPSYQEPTCYSQSDLNQFYLPYHDLQLVDPITTTNIGDFVIDEGIDLCLQNFLICNQHYQPYYNLYLEENSHPQQQLQLQEEISLSTKSNLRL
ncbi:hypothetical protein RclHR1_06930004 [Rhizophagus clarus]|uniref:HMG box domain-containing protein n=1 Tax=Rhizophagus clarus TaxID=94130 RepID=A0A2Z6S6W0_9GLOM|nr:hypothetical protein RclHR1_06930004 [Rhizophagus clarus]GES99787.1 hypothetical protein GLOIN_2v1513469 [Rhizophagus clarus]